MACEIINYASVMQEIQEESNDDKKIVACKNLAFMELQNPNEEAIKTKEQAILLLGGILSQKKMASELSQLIHSTRPFLLQVSKAKAGKLVRSLVDQYLEMEAGTGQEIDLCNECIAWANQERRAYLRQSLEAKLMGLYFDNNQYDAALTLGSKLLKELKKLDDKALLVEVQLLESKVYYQLGNLQRSRAALTSARTTANGIYCPPKLQASLDMQSGILHAADERDFKTAFSYFYEAFEGYDSIDNKKAIDALKYMLLSKIMLNCADEVPGIISGKLALKYAGPDVEAMREIGIAAKQRSLADFVKIKEKYSRELTADPVISKHLGSLYDTLLSQNLIKLIEPFSRVEISHIAELIKLPHHTVERKLSQMILDKKFNGILDQGTGVLVVFDEFNDNQCYKTSIETIHSLSKVVDQLYHKAKKLT